MLYFEDQIAAAVPKNCSTKKFESDRKTKKKKGRRRPSLDFLFNSDLVGQNFIPIRGDENRNRKDFRTKAPKIFEVEYCAGQFDEYLDKAEQVIDDYYCQRTNDKTLFN